MYYEQPAAEDKVLILRLDLKENESPLDENHPNQCKPPVLANQQLAEELQWEAWRRGYCSKQAHYPASGKGTHRVMESDGK